MDHGRGDPAHKRLEVGVQHGASHVVAVQVGTVQHQHVDLGFCAGFHDEHECAHIGVKPRPTSWMSKTTTSMPFS